MSFEAEKDQGRTLDADLVICASGLLPDTDFIKTLTVDKNEKGLIEVDKFSETSIPGLFATGDIVTGPSTVANAIGQGRQTALSVHSRLLDLPDYTETAFIKNADGSFSLETGKTANPAQPHIVSFREIENPSYHPKTPRQKILRNNNSLLPFAEMDEGFSDMQALMEATRCMHCGHCIDCGTCVERCPNYILERDEDGPFVRYPEECWHCSCCRIGCPTGSITIEFPITMLV